MNRKKIFLIAPTITPEFFNVEFSFLEENFDQIYVITEKLHDNIKNIPDNFSIHIIDKNARIELFKRPDLLLDIFFEIFRAKTLKVRYLFNFCNEAILIQEKVKQIMQEDNLKPEEVTLYSWWFMSGAYAISNLKQKDKKFKAISRAHRYDLYKDSGPQPFKTKILKNIDKVLSCSKQGSKYLKNNYSAFKNKIGYSYLGTLNEDFNYTEKKNYTIVSCSYIRPVKRIELIIDVLSKFKKDSNLNWIHIGSGEDLSKYKSLASKRLEIDFKFVGHLSNDAVLDFFRTKDVKCFINLSASEGLPVSMMEVQSFGIPIIGTDVGGVNEIVNENTGVLVSANPEIEEVYSAINKIVFAPKETYIKYQHNARSHWNINFNAKNNYNDFIIKYLK